MATFTRKASGLALVLCVGSVGISCDKKGATPETPGFRLFISKMEITDATVKANFLKRSAAKFPALAPVGPADKIVFLTPDTVKFGTSTLPYSVVKKGTQYLFYSPLLVQLSNQNQLIQDMLKYTAPKVAVPAYLNIDYVTQEVRVGYGDAKQIQLSYLQYYWVKSNGGWATGTLFNEVNDGVSAKIAGTDTLAVQTGSASIPVQ
jgi:hypothetical protein